MPDMTDNALLRRVEAERDTKEPFPTRTLILGNSGSGKSWLATRMAQVLGARAIDLDVIHWEPGGYGVPRDKHAAIGMVRQDASGPTWVIEGVYGWLAQEVLSRTMVLIWLDIPLAQCLANLQQRGQRHGGDTASFNALLAWAADYEERQTSSSFAGHARIFTAFPGTKLRFLSREDVTRFVEKLRPAFDR